MFDRIRHGDLCPDCHAGTVLASESKNMSGPVLTCDECGREFADGAEHDRPETWGEQA